jgi:hypothetical protein
MILLLASLGNRKMRNLRKKTDWTGHRRFILVLCAMCVLTGCAGLHLWRSKLVAYEAEPGLFQAELDVPQDRTWAAAVDVFRKTALLEADLDKLFLKGMIEPDIVVECTILRRTENFSAFTVKAYTLTDSKPQSAVAEKTAREVYNGARSLSAALRRRFSSDDRK